MWLPACLYPPRIRSFKIDAFHHCGNSVRDVGAWASDCLHHVGFHSHFAGARGRGRAHPRDPGAAGHLMSITTRNRLVLVGAILVTANAAFAQVDMQLRARQLPGWDRLAREGRCEIRLWVDSKAEVRMRGD